ncbi:bifunctional glycoside hydrolase 114/ polysaccharide deacetylase family protein [Andreprevotia chitinilytica]|uniref:bifunctional glycoside hydrolase 114/ polysaccharide deacetylase family protein n=1 Tax=Andreprevotia chitinilytica TaxID=396808 RepID=UPI00068C5082|nr:bifunctional glycoside hydrolase 114/ polysaccharide deacetylase family protein [Andreprevotia chitinilytica]
MPLLKLVFSIFLTFCALAATAAPNVAFYYGEHPPLQQLALYDWAVVEPGHLAQAPQTGKTRWFAYLSLGEFTPDRSYAKSVPTAWRLGANKDWGSVIVDQSQPDWPAFVVEKMVTPLWRQGYRGFFLDTLDAWAAVAKTDADRQHQIDGLVRVIQAIKARYPEAQLIANRGFEILPRTHDQFAAVAFESLIQGWDAGKKRYGPVPDADRQWLLGQLKTVTDLYKLPVIAIDYAPAGERKAAQEIARKIEGYGFTPWVADSTLTTLGVGKLEPLPRKVYVLYNAKTTPSVMADSQLSVSTPLNYLGLYPRYIDVSGELPADIQSGQVAGVISWVDDGELPLKARGWLRQVVGAGVPWVALNNFGFTLDGEWQRLLGLRADGGKQSENNTTIALRDPVYNGEVSVAAQRDGFMGWTVRAGTPLLTLKTPAGRRYDAAAITPWGGYALAPYLLTALPDKTNRWNFDPITFLARALRLPDMPVADVTTENGRRLQMFHIDGDGFVSKAERPGYPFAGEVMLNEVLKKYPIPMTISVIEGEIGPTGLYPKDSPALEDIARRTFALPNIEIASHSYSHPFKWSLVETGKGEDYHLDIPGYTFNLDREVSGSINYINKRLAPPGKSVKVFLWPGDCDPLPEAIKAVREAGVLAMNGGDTVINRSQPSLMLAAPIGLYKGDELQIFAPNQDENVYTNNWTGPFYGYRRVIETFELTDSPRRIKPIDIYVHYYTATKRASLDALHEVMRWSIQQRTLPVYASDYITRAQSFYNDFSIARDGNGYAIHAGAVRTVRIAPSLGYPDMTASENIAGFSDHGSERYIHLTGNDARLVLQATPPQQSLLVDANAMTTGWQRIGTGANTGFRLTLKPATQGISATFANIGKCQLLADGRPAPTTREGVNTRIDLPNAHAAVTIETRCTGQ